jgi:SWI/SNF-related matrix-associated actin-dependent regulator 1 of chromatin subfamily A
MPQLRNYQKEDVMFLKNLSSAACFNEQRTGKTPTALITLDSRGCNKILIICPSSAVYQWQDEYITWLNKPCEVAVGTPKQRQEAINNWTSGLVINYENIRDIYDKEGNLKRPGEAKTLLNAKPDAVILDEAHRIKSPKNNTTKAVFNFTKIPNKLALTGTPAPNKPYEITCILMWLFPKQFTSYWNFIEEYFEKDIVPRFQGRPYINIGPFKPGKAEELQQFLSTISTQRKRKEIMPWLPDKDYQKIKLPCTKEQKKYLYELEHYFETEHIITQGVLDRLVRYRQICLHPALLNLKGQSPKTEWIRQYIADYPEKSIIIFSKFTSYLKILQNILKKEKIGVIIGDTPIKERELIKTNFQKGKINILLLNIDAGKEALTLDRAETAIFTDKYPPVGDILQAEDRFIATTEAKASKAHLIIELMMKNTYDEELYKLLDKRKTETDIINDYRNYLKIKAIS